MPVTQRNATVAAIRDYMDATGERLTFTQTRTAVRLGWDDPKVVRSSLAGDWLPAGTIVLVGTVGPSKWPMAAEIEPDGNVRHAGVYSDD